MAKKRSAKKVAKELPARATMCAIGEVDPSATEASSEVRPTKPDPVAVIRAAAKMTDDEFPKNGYCSRNPNIRLTPQQTELQHQMFHEINRLGGKLTKPSQVINFLLDRLAEDPEDFIRAISRNRK